MRKGVLEKQLADAVVGFWRQLLGRGPDDAHAFVVQDMVIVRLRNALTAEERSLSQDDRGRQLVKQARVLLREMYGAEIEAIVAEKTGQKVISSHGDISTRTGERVEIYILESNLERQLTE